MALFLNEWMMPTQGSTFDGPTNKPGGQLSRFVVFYEDEWVDRWIRRLGIGPLGVMVASTNANEPIGIYDVGVQGYQPRIVIDLSTAAGDPIFPQPPPAPPPPGGPLALGYTGKKYETNLDVKGLHLYLLSELFGRDNARAMEQKRGFDAPWIRSKANSYAGMR